MFFFRPTALSKVRSLLLPKLSLSLVFAQREKDKNDRFKVYLLFIGLQSIFVLSSGFIITDDLDSPDCSTHNLMTILEKLCLKELCSLKRADPQFVRQGVFGPGEVVLKLLNQKQRLISQSQNFCDEKAGHLIYLVFHHQLSSPGSLVNEYLKHRSISYSSISTVMALRSLILEYQPIDYEAPNFFLFALLKHFIIILLGLRERFPIIGNTSSQTPKLDWLV